MFSRLLQNGANDILTHMKQSKRAHIWKEAPWNTIMAQKELWDETSSQTSKICSGSSKFWSFTKLIISSWQPHVLAKQKSVRSFSNLAFHFTGRPITNSPISWRVQMDLDMNELECVNIPWDCQCDWCSTPIAHLTLLVADKCLEICPDFPSRLNLVQDKRLLLPQTIVSPPFSVLLDSYN